MATPRLQHELGLLRQRDLMEVDSLARPTLAEWRATPELHAHWWPCFCCKKVTSVHSEVCVDCGASRETLSGSAMQAQLEAGIAIAHRTAYGRNLVCTSDRAALLSEGTSVAIGAPGYAEALRSELRLYASRPCEMFIEDKPHSCICGFDGWLTLQTNAET